MAFNKLRVVFKSAYEPNNLLKTNVAASGVLLLIGDVIQQSIELYRGVHDKGEPCHQGQRWRHCLWSKYIYKFYKPTIGVTYWWIWFWWFWSGSYDILRSSRMLAIGLFHGAPRHFFYVRLEKSKTFDQIWSKNDHLIIQVSLGHPSSAQQRKFSLIRSDLHDSSDDD